MDEKKFLQALSDMMDVKLQPLKNDVQELKSEVKTLKDDVQELKSEVKTLKSEVQTLKDDVQTLKDDVQELKSEVQTLEGNMQNTEQKLCSIELTLENETNRNIKIVAEGHSLLNRRLDKALGVESERELILVRLNHLEDEVRILKEERRHELTV